MKPSRLGYIVIGSLWLFYAVISLIWAHDVTDAFRGSLILTEFIRLTVIVPVLVIWLVAWHGAVRFRAYSQIIRDSPDGRALKLVSDGLFWLVLYVVAVPLIGALVRFASHSAWLLPAVGLRNHLPVLASLLACGFIFLGSERLNRLVGARTWSWRRITFLFVPFCLFALWFTVQFYNHVPGADANGIPRYALGNDALLFTYVLPNLASWLLGFLASLNIATYARKASGSLYKGAFRNLSVGVLVVVLSLIVVQIFSILAVAMFKLPVGGLLVLIYVLLSMAAGGFWYVNRGAKKLGRLESA